MIKKLGDVVMIQLSDIDSNIYILGDTVIDAGTGFNFTRLQDFLKVMQKKLDDFVFAGRGSGHEVGSAITLFPPVNISALVNKDLCNINSAFSADMFHGGPPKRVSDISVRPRFQDQVDHFFVFFFNGGK